MPKEYTIDDFYKIKKKYESSIKKEKNAILKDTGLSNEEKKIKFSSINKKCINCKNSGGTEFRQTSDFLIIKCGAKKKCNLSIKISHGNTHNLFDLLKEVTENLQEIKQNIIKIKLDLYFKYINEDDALRTFEKNKQQLSEVNKLHITLNNQLSKIHNDVEINEYKKQFEDQINDFKNLFTIQQEYNIEQLIETYINKIIPICSTLRKIKYKYNFIESNKGLPIKDSNLNDQVYLKQLPYSIKDLEIQLKS